jgi:osmotically-inducible protein OsmY
MASAALALAFSALAQDTGDAPAKAPDPAPITQGDNKADLKRTAKIQKEIMASNQMSVNAQNVKVVTNEGKVTLSGPVDTAKEKRLIGEIAVRCAGPGDVDNQLEVQVGQPTPPDTPKGQ